MGNIAENSMSVSYTHLDVYKRQGVYSDRSSLYLLAGKKNETAFGSVSFRNSRYAGKGTRASGELSWAGRIRKHGPQLHSDGRAVRGK